MVVTILVSGLVSFSTMNAYAGVTLNCESTQTGFWDVSSTWTSCGDGVPDNGDNVTIKNGHTVIIRTDLGALTGLSLTVEQSAELVLDGPSGGRLEIVGGTFTNLGKTTLDGVGAQAVRARLLLSVSSSGTNECGGTIDVNGGSTPNSGLLNVNNSIFINKGTIDLSGGGGPGAGSLTVVGGTAQLDNHGIINENPGAGENSGIVHLINNENFNDNLPNLCRQVGGEIIPIETTALILAGAQTFSWMIPVIVSAIGIGIFVVSRKSE